MRLLVLVLALAAGCAALRPQPSAHHPAPHVTRFAVDLSLRPWRAPIVAGLAALARGGLAVAVVPPGALGDVIVRHGDDAVAGCPAAGMYFPDRRVIELWPACLAGLQWRVVAMHEGLHALGALRHVCRYPGELPADRCDPAGYGPAILNPTLPPPPDACDPFAGHACVDDDAQLTLTDLDRRALRRVGALPPR